MIVGLVLLMFLVHWFRLYQTSKNTSLKEVDMHLNRGNAEKWNFTWRFCLLPLFHHNYHCLALLSTLS